MEYFLELIINNPKTSFTIISAFISLLFGYKRLRIAQEKHQMDTNEYLEKNLKFRIYLIDCYRVMKTDKRYLIFHVRISNLANIKNSFSASLDVSYIIEGKKTNTINLQHNSELFESIEHQKLTQLDTDIRIEEKEIKTGWLIFSYPNNLYQSRIEKFTININDVYENALSIDSYIMKDIVHENI